MLFNGLVGLLLICQSGFVSQCTESLVFGWLFSTNTPPHLLGNLTFLFSFISFLLVTIKMCFNAVR